MVRERRKTLWEGGGEIPGEKRAVMHQETFLAEAT